MKLIRSELIWFWKEVNYNNNIITTAILHEFSACGIPFMFD